MLNKSQLIEALVEEGAGDRRHVNHVLNSLAEVAASEIEKGEDFVIPGVAKLTFTYRKPQKKGQRWKKGDTVTGFGGIEAVKDEDSPAVKAAIKLKAVPTGKVARLKPGSKPEAQSDFLKSKAGRNVARRRG
jgi:nucleoid DNA-binding protein